MESSRDIATLLGIMARLRTPGSGCEWDLRQTFATIAPYTIEEAHEVADAIERGDRADLCEELGDLLLQVAYHARMAEEAGWFDFGDVVAAISAKMIRRHPHVFGGGARPDDPAAAWARIKAEEEAAKRAVRGSGAPPSEVDAAHARTVEAASVAPRLSHERERAHEHEGRSRANEDGSGAAQDLGGALDLGAARPPSVLDGVARALPALMRAQKLSSRAAEVGFDWSEAGEILAKLREEVAEVEGAVAGGDRDDQADEVGDVLFTAVNLARRLGLDAEAALRGTNAKFERRFRFIEAALAAEGRSPEGASLAEMEALWRAAKDEERPSPGGLWSVP